MKIWTKLCKLKGCSVHTGRELEKAIQFDGEFFEAHKYLLIR